MPDHARIARIVTARLPHELRHCADRLDTALRSDDHVATRKAIMRIRINLRLLERTLSQQYPDEYCVIDD